MTTSSNLASSAWNSLSFSICEIISSSSYSLLASWSILRFWFSPECPSNTCKMSLFILLMTDLVSVVIPAANIELSNNCLTIIAAKIANNLTYGNISLAHLVKLHDDFMVRVDFHRQVLIQLVRVRTVHHPHHLSQPAAHLSHHYRGTVAQTLRYGDFLDDGLKLVFYPAFVK